jgi:hypothetical protein
MTYKAQKEESTESRNRAGKNLIYKLNRQDSWKKKETEKMGGKNRYKTYLKERNKPKGETLGSVLSLSREAASTDAPSSDSPHPPSQSSD